MAMKPSTYALSSLVLTVLSSATTLLAPRILSETEFAAFVVLTSFFQMTSRFDLGLSERADQHSARRMSLMNGSDSLIAARFVIAASIFALSFIALSLFKIQIPMISNTDVLLALGSGLLAMVAVGPVTVARGRNDIRTFAILALSLQLGMTAPRFLGIIFGGTTGCFSVLLIWYFLFSTRALLGLKTAKIECKALLNEIRNALPLFAFSTLWLGYQFSARWISVFISNPESFAQLAFAFNLLAIMTGTLTTIGQAYYPKYLVLASNHQTKELDDQFQKAAITLLLGFFFVLLLGLPFMHAGLSAFYVNHLKNITKIMIMSVAILPLSLALWFTPLILALTLRPLIDALFFLMPSFLSLLILMVIGNQFASSQGQAYAILASSFVTLILCLTLLTRHKITSIRSASSYYNLSFGLTLFLLIEIHFIS